MTKIDDKELLEDVNEAEAKDGLTPDQRRAIKAIDKTLLISAAAGSGKTFTLTKRIIKRIIDDGANITDMLIVTFTRASASDMRVKIFKALSEAIAENPGNDHLASQLTKIGSAKICTIDSFCYDLLQDNMSDADMTSIPRIADNAQYLIVANASMEKTIESFYESNSDFPSFVECFVNAKTNNLLGKSLLNIYDKLQTLRDGIEFLVKCADNIEKEAELDFFSTSYGKILQNSSKEIFNHYLPILNDAVEFAEMDDNVNDVYGEQFRTDLKLCQELCDIVMDEKDGYARIRELLLGYAPEGLGRLSGTYASETSSMYKDERNAFKEKMFSLRDRSFSLPKKSVSAAMKDTAKYIRILYELLFEFDRAVDAEKSRMGIITFNDIRRKVYNLVVKEIKDGEPVPTEIAKQYQQQFSDVFIDEYQDVDQVQDTIFSAISKPTNRFMVGDIKQSIYEFRSADPSLFKSYREKFPLLTSDRGKNSSNASIFMSENFRCDETVIDFTNLVCSKLFSVAAKSIGYTKEDDLRYAKQQVTEDYIPQKIKITTLSFPDPRTKNKPEHIKDLTAYDCEAEYIASQIEELLKNGTKEDKDSETGFSKLMPGDIAIILRKRKMIPFISAALRKRNILSTDADATKYFENPDVLMVLCVLNAIDNPERDIYLTGALYSPIFNFSIDDVIKIRYPFKKSNSLYSALCAYANDHNDTLASKCKDFIKTLESWQLQAASLPIDRFLLFLFDDPRFCETGIVAQPNDDGDGGNLLLLYEYARGFENGSFKGLYQFIEYINSVIEKDEKIELTEGGKSENKVYITTMHGSKGLEFPVCFLSRMSGSIKSKDIKDNFVFDKKYGIGMKVSDETGIGVINTPLREAIISKIIEKQAEEEMRILYVALTRAKEKLYITSTATNTQNLLQGAKNSAIYLDKYTIVNEISTYLKWILICCPPVDNPIYEMEFIDGVEFLKQLDTEDKEVEKTSFSADPELTQKLIDKFDFDYKYAKLSTVASKLSVSRLEPDILSEKPDGKDLEAERRKKDNKPKKAKIPAMFLSESETNVKEISASERGTATHLFLQFCNFEALKDKESIIAERSRLIDKEKFIHKIYEDLIYVDELEKFIHSELFNKILSAKEVIREQRFNVKFPVVDFAEEGTFDEYTQDEMLVVQGVIDLVLINEDGSIELYDYKTDRLSENQLNNYNAAKEKLSQAHARQLSYYAKAAEQLFTKKCSRVAIYSTCSAQLYDIDVN